MAKWPAHYTVAGLLLVSNLLMMLFFVGGASIFSRHAEVLDESTITACLAAARQEQGVGVGHERVVDFDGADVLRIRYLSVRGPTIAVLRCRYSLPTDEGEPPVIEDVAVSSQ